MEKHPFDTVKDSCAILSHLREQRIFIFDGAIGTELVRRGLDTSPSVNLNSPADILSFHREYAAAGVDALTTNTFAANRIYAETHGISADLQKINLAGARLAREAAGNTQYVFGDIGPTGQLLKPYGEYSEQQFYANYLEQALTLAGGGVDGYIIETMIDLREAICALKACREASNLPVFVTLSFSTVEKGGRTIMGNTAAETALALEKDGADAVGANCGDLSPMDLARIAYIFSQHTALPVVIQPNAGRPKIQGKQTVYDMSPHEFADGLKECASGGAAVLGGCCGTTLAHLQAAIALLR